MLAAQTLAGNSFPSVTASADALERWNIPLIRCKVCRNHR